MRHIFTFFSIFLLGIGARAQTGELSGKVTSENTALPSATITIRRLQLGASTDTAGNYSIKNIPVGTYKIIATSVGLSSIY